MSGMPTRSGSEVHNVRQTHACNKGEMQNLHMTPRPGVGVDPHQGWGRHNINCGVHHPLMMPAGLQAPHHPPAGRGGLARPPESQKKDIPGQAAVWQYMAGLGHAQEHPKPNHKQKESQHDPNGNDLTPRQCITPKAPKDSGLNHSRPKMTLRFRDQMSTTVFLVWKYCFNSVSMPRYGHVLVYNAHAWATTHVGTIIAPPVSPDSQLKFEL